MNILIISSDDNNLRVLRDIIDSMTPRNSHTVAVMPNVDSVYTTQYAHPDKSIYDCMVIDLASLSPKEDNALEMLLRKPDCCKSILTGYQLRLQGFRYDQCTNLYTRLWHPVSRNQLVVAINEIQAKLTAKALSQVSVEPAA